MNSMSTNRNIKISTAPNIKRALKACSDAGFPPKSIWLRQHGDIMVFFEEKAINIEMEYNEWDEKWSMKDE